MTNHTPTMIDPHDTTAEAGEVDAMALLMADHDEVSAMFNEFHETGHAGDADMERLEWVEQICQALKVHAAIEEELFYPAAREALGDPGLIEQAEEEHATAAALIEQLEAMHPSDPQFDRTVQQLQSAVEQHVQQEEEVLFPLLRGSSLEVMALGQQMAERRDDLLSQMQDERTEV